MLDARARSYIDPPLNRLAAELARAGVRADQVTIAAVVLGLAAALAIAIGAYAGAVLLFLLGRLLDGLDGAVARQSTPTNRGAYLDIVLDFAVYAAIPLAFAFADPQRNALAAAALLAGIVVNGTAFLGFALMAERLKLETQAQGAKSLYYISGLAEGTETIAVYVLCCLFPAWFPQLAFVFAAVCFVSAAARIVIAWQLLSR